MAAMQERRTRARYFAANVGHEWAGSSDAAGNKQPQRANALDFTDMAWQFFSTIHSK
jgi:hypothetical protein